MYKLTIISGPNRGTSYAVSDGSVSIGRQTGNSIVLSSSKVSKRHCTLVVENGAAFVKDEGSSNGTFVNGILIKSRRVKPGDRISVGEFVLELTEPSRKANSLAPAVGFGKNQLQFPTSGGMMGQLNPAQLGQPAATPNQAPKDIKGKLIWYFENQFMPFFYNLNAKHEWRVICIGMVSTFVIGNLFISVYPLTESNRIALIRETALRAKAMARQIADQNAPFIAARAETKAEIGSIENAEGVRIAVLTDLDNRIIAPGSRLNQYLPSGPESLLAVKARDLFRSGRETGFWNEVDSTTVVAIEPVKVLSPSAGRNVVVAMAIVSIDTSITTPDLGELGMAYSETLILTGLLAGLIFLILYKITLKPLEVLNVDMDKALKGEISQVTRDSKFEELNSLMEIINSAIQRVQRAGSSSDSLGGGIGSAPVIDEYAGPMRMIGNLAKFGFVIFDADRKIVYLNSIFEEISGIRSDGSIGQDMADVARDQSMGAFTADILGRAMGGGDGLMEDYDFSGVAYKIYVAAFGQSGGSPRCYILAAVKVDS